MVLVNKSVAIIFKSPWGLIFAQNVIQTVVLCVAMLLNVFSVKLNVKTIWHMAPLNIFFVGMLYTSMQALQRLPVPIITVIKNCCNVLIVFGDWYFYGNKIMYGVVVALAIVVLSAIMTYIATVRLASPSDTHHVRPLAAATHNEINDGLSEFYSGIFWMCANLICTASYSLYARTAKKKTQLTPGSMSFVNGVVSLPIILIFSFLVRDENGNLGSLFLFQLPQSVMAASVLQQFQLFLSGVVGCLLGACVFWCISETSPTTLSFVGALNKFPGTILGAFFFGSQTTFFGWLFIFLNMTGSFVYVLAKAHKLGAFMSKDFCKNFSQWRSKASKSNKEKQLEQRGKNLEMMERGTEKNKDTYSK